MMQRRDAVLLMVVLRSGGTGPHWINWSFSEGPSIDIERTGAIARFARSRAGARLTAVMACISTRVASSRYHFCADLDRVDLSTLHSKMSGRWGGRFAPNAEGELRRTLKEPVRCVFGFYLMGICLNRASSASGGRSGELWRRIQPTES